MKIPKNTVFLKPFLGFLINFWYFYQFFFCQFGIFTHFLLLPIWVFLPILVFANLVFLPILFFLPIWVFSRFFLPIWVFLPILLFAKLGIFTNFCHFYNILCELFFGNLYITVLCFWKKKDLQIFDGSWNSL